MKDLSVPISVILACFLLCLSVLTGCGERAVSASQPAVSGTSGAGNSSGGIVKVRPPHHKPADHQIIVMFGPDYAGKQGLLSGLTEEYGLVGFGGMMRVMSWPDSFLVNKHPRLSVLSDAAKESTATIIVAVGAPEGTVEELIRIRRAHPAMKIITIFPEDGALQVEAVSNLVVDQNVSADVPASESTETGGTVSGSAGSDSELGVLLLAAALSVDGKDTGASVLTNLTASIDTARNLMKQKKACAAWHFAFFVDPDTGLRAQNHVAIEVPVKNAVAAAQTAVSAPSGESKKHE